MNRTQISAVFYIAATIIYSVNLDNLVILLCWYVTLIAFAFSAWRDK